MQKLNIYDYLTSDTADHCKSIGHDFSPLDMAVIIAYSKKAIKEKIAAWQQIVDGCPDMPIRPNDAEMPKNPTGGRASRKNTQTLILAPIPCNPAPLSKARMYRLSLERPLSAGHQIIRSV